MPKQKSPVLSDLAHVRKTSHYSNARGFVSLLFYLAAAGVVLQGLATIMMGGPGILLGLPLMVLGLAIGACAAIPAALFDMADVQLRADARARAAELRALSRSNP